MPHPSVLLRTTEGRRLAGDQAPLWRAWGPYASDRQWGTVREDYSEGGTAWDYFPHDHARSRAYRWGEDAIAGYADAQCRAVLGLAVWNGQDPVIKERLFGLTNREGNHGEDVKELYFHQDAVPSHAYLRFMYKYPQRAFPYADLVAENARRGPEQDEYEVLDTGVFSNNRYFDIVVEYARRTPDDVLMRITAHNRADETAPLWLLPQLTLRNTWRWSGHANRPRLAATPGGVLLTDDVMGRMRLCADRDVEFLFCENETNVTRLYGLVAEGPFKDGINDYLIDGNENAVRRDAGSRCAALWRTDIAAGGSASLILRLGPDAAMADGCTGADRIFATRRGEADDFYEALQRGIESADMRLVQRQALAGLIWSKQFYHYDVYRWLRGDPAEPAPPAARWQGRNAEWQHLANAHIVSMPDKWEYPWYASWDLAFQAIAFALIDPAFAKEQVLLLLRDRFMHPNGQIPAYEWAFGDANPPLHAWAAWRCYEADRDFNGRPDHDFLRTAFNKLLLNFGWWVNRKDSAGRNIFQGGFLGLDNIEIFDRSSPLPTGGMLDQPDGTGWMASFALNMLRISLELAKVDPGYQDVAVKFLEHFLHIAKALGDAKHDTSLWDDQDQFFYDRLCLPDGMRTPLRVRSAVGLIPLMAVQVLEPDLLDGLPEFTQAATWFLSHRPDLASLVAFMGDPGHGARRMLSLLRTHRLTMLLRRMLDPAEFLSDFGLRAVSKAHEAAPFVFRYDGCEYRLDYEPAESRNREFGGNSNWRGPIWMPVNYRLIEALYEYARYYGDTFKVEFPVGSGKFLTLEQTAALLSHRLINLFVAGPGGRRPVMAAYPQLQDMPESEPLVLFHEYFHGDTGRGVGASHQTGWTACIALLIATRHDCISSNLPMAMPEEDPPAA